MNLSDGKKSNYLVILLILLGIIISGFRPEIKAWLYQPKSVEREDENLRDPEKSVISARAKNPRESCIGAFTDECREAIYERYVRIYTDFGTGTGVIDEVRVMGSKKVISIVTAGHVVQGATSITVEKSGEWRRKAVAASSVKSGYDFACVILDYNGENEHTIPNYEELTPVPDRYLRSSLEYLHFNINRSSQHVYSIVKLSQVVPQSRQSAVFEFIAEPGMSGSGVFDNRGYFVGVIEAVSQNFDLTIISRYPPTNKKFREADLDFEIYDEPFVTELFQSH